MQSSEEDLEHAVDRLAFAILHEPDKRLVFVIGSGLSLPSVPGTAAMLDYFSREAGGFSKDLWADLRKRDPGTAYRSAARQLKQRRGDRGLASAIARAVLEAYQGQTPDSGDPVDDFWTLPESQRELAALIASIPAQQRGPVYTTNFDPLTEVALRREGIAVTAVAASANAPLPVDQIFDSLPVVHLHGYWQKSATLSTVAQLEHPRPGVEEMLHTQFRNALVVVLGYGGWNDSFSRAITKAVGDGRLAALETELLLMNHAHRDAGPGIFSELAGAAGVNEYYGIDASRLLSGTSRQLRQLQRSDRRAYAGWLAVPSLGEVEPAESAALVRFTEGAQPTWTDARSLPRLSATEEALAAYQRQASEVGDQVILLVGPTGEGKSLGLMQVGLTVMSREGSVGLLRLPGAQKMSPEWVAHLRSEAVETVLFVDEADLVFDDVVRSLEPNASRRIIWVMAMHSHYRERVEKVMQGTAAVRLVEFGDMTASDSLAIAASWVERGMLPERYADRSAQEVAAILTEAGTSVNGRSLFGAVLHLWMGDGLFDRVADLLTKLERASIRGRTFSWLLAAIAVVQEAWDPEEEFGSGMSLAALGSLCDLRSADVTSLIVAPLGREVGLSQVGDRVYVRHSAIAEAISEILEDRGELVSLVEELGKYGARMRMDRTYSRDESDCLYHLSSRYSDDPLLALAAARGAVNGAPNLLEPRVTYLATQRRRTHQEDAVAYASKIATQIHNYSDWRSTQRGFWVEYANCEAGLGHIDTAVGMAARSLTDMRGAFMGKEQLQYGLVNTAVFSRRLIHGSFGPAADLYRACLDLLTFIPSSQGILGAVRKHRRSSDSLVGLVSDFRIASLPFARQQDLVGEWKFQRMLSVMAEVAER